MRISSRVCLLPALTILLLGQVAISPGAGQTRDNAAVQTGENLTSVFRRKDLESVLGREVRTRVEEDVGRVIDLLVDNQGRVQAAVIEFGGFLGIGTRKIAVEWSAMRFEGDGKRTRVVVELTRDQLRVSPEYKPSEPAVVQGASD
jgi:hypothetical protein